VDAVSTAGAGAALFSAALGKPALAAGAGGWLVETAVPAPGTGGLPAGSTLPPAKMRISEPKRR
jgi:hypothetical protein